MTFANKSRLIELAIAILLLIGARRMPPMKIGTPMKLSIALWLLFSIYWAIASRQSKSTESSESLASRQLHVILVNGALLLLVLPIPGLRARFLYESNVVIAIGLVIQIASLVLAISARHHLGRNWSGEVRIASEHELIRSGPYRFVRHPIYSAILGMYIGTMLVSGEIHAPIAFVIVTLAYWRKIRLEERALHERFGEEFAAYCSETSALVPGVI